MTKINFYILSAVVDWLKLFFSTERTNFILYTEDQNFKSEIFFKPRRFLTQDNEHDLDQPVI